MRYSAKVFLRANSNQHICKMETGGSPIISRKTNYEISDDDKKAIVIADQSLVCLVYLNIISHVDIKMKYYKEKMLYIAAIYSHY